MFHNTLENYPDYSNYSDFDLSSLDSRLSTSLQNLCNSSSNNNKKDKLINWLPILNSFFFQKTKNFAQRRRNSYNVIYSSSSANRNKKCLDKKTNNLHIMELNLRQEIQPLLIPYKFLQLHEIVGTGNSF